MPWDTESCGSQGHESSKHIFLWFQESRVGGEEAVMGIGIVWVNCFSHGRWCFPLRISCAWTSSLQPYPQELNTICSLASLLVFTLCLISDFPVSLRICWWAHQNVLEHHSQGPCWMGRHHLWVINKAKSPTQQKTTVICRMPRQLRSQGLPPSIREAGDSVTVEVGNPHLLPGRCCVLFECHNFISAILHSILPKRVVHFWCRKQSSMKTMPCTCVYVKCLEGHSVFLIFVCACTVLVYGATF